MKKQFKANPIGRSAITRLLMMLIILAFSSTSLYAQSCLGSSLNINTGEGGHPTSPFSVLPGNPDPAWIISAKGAIFTPPAVGGSAIVVSGPTTWGMIAGGGQWICDNADNNVTGPTRGHAFPGILTGPGTGAELTFQRSFRLCSGGDITFDMLILNDNFVRQILVDGTVVAGWAQVMGTHYTGTPWHPIFTQTLAAGTHTLEIVVNDEDGSTTTDNPTGLLVKGNITAASSIIVLDAETGCDSFQCPGCEETCYWKLDGNTIPTGLNNIFGTWNDRDIRVISNRTGAGIDRGIIKGGNATTGGFFGWNTTSPTARLHVNCTNGNTQASGLSDIRFQDLETSSNVELTTLAIDPLGYVFRTNVPLNGGNKWDLLGNTITSSNFMGTINNEDIRFNTYTSGSSPFSNSQRMVIKGSSSGTQNDPMAGFVGVNTASPTARFHVDCANGNTQASGISDIRFQALETKNDDQLTLLAIDHAGYVYNTGQPLSGGSSTAWDINGNTAPATSKFGITMPTGQDITLHTNGLQRGVMTAGIALNDDGRLGWRTPAPTAALHVNCAGANPDDGGMGSDVRFEALEPGNGNILVIDDQGYVYNSNIKITDLTGGGDAGMMKRKVDELEKQVTELKNIITNSAKTDKITPVSGNELYQNNPNPFGVETSIGYNIVRMQQSAFVAIYDLNGRELYRYAVTAKGKGSVTVSGDKLVPGQYLYSLIVDGREEATKKMVVSK